MRKIIITTVLLAIAAGCSERFPEPKNIATVSFVFQENNGTKVVSINDNTISNMNVFVYDATTKAKVYSEYRYGTISSISFEAIPGQKYDFYFIANCGNLLSETYTSTSDDLKQYKISITGPTGFAKKGDIIAMSGVSLQQGILSNSSLAILLMRCVAMISVDFDLSALSDVSSFKVTRLQMKNVPNTMSLFAPSSASQSTDILINGESANYSDLTKINDGKTVSLYMFENMQGDLLPENNLQSGKCFDDTNRYSELCSYMEIDVDYRSSKSYGTVTYRCYLGSDLTSNFDVERNHNYFVTIKPSDDGLDENSWRISKTMLNYYVSEIVMNLDTDLYYGQKYTICADIYPTEATNKNLAYSYDNNFIQIQNGIITPLNAGTTTIIATSCDGSMIKDTISVNIIKEITGLQIQNLGSTLVCGTSVRGDVYIIYNNTNTREWISPDKCSWTCDNEGIINLSTTNKLMLYGMRLGIVTISCEYNGYTGSHTITTLNGITKIEFEPEELYFTYLSTFTELEVYLTWNTDPSTKRKMDNRDFVWYLIDDLSREWFYVNEKGEITSLPSELGYSYGELCCEYKYNRNISSSILISSSIYY